MAGCFEYYADLAEKLDKRQGEALELPMAEFKGAIRREPLGVVGLITPWNYPMLMAAVSHLHSATGIHCSLFCMQCIVKTLACSANAKSVIVMTHAPNDLLEGCMSKALLVGTAAQPDQTF